MKILIGGSPCTKWSIANNAGRETTAEGIGWELFSNYRVALDKYRPDYFLYENNQSMSPAIREQISEELGVKPTLINSKLVSAQNRCRLYWVGRRCEDGTYVQVEVYQPADCGIQLQDILETGGYRLTNISSLTDREVELTEAYCVAQRGRYIGEGGSVAQHFEAREDGKTNTITTVQKDNLVAIRVESTVTQSEIGFPVYQVVDGCILVKGKEYPIRLRDGCYIIRKLTVTECKRLQTVPDTYVFPVSDSQAYKMLGNGWTVDVIAHIMSHFDGLTAEPVEVLSMYDGMSCGHIALDKLGAEVSAYYATEIDKYAIQTTQHNFPETVQLGDAFQVRDEGWRPWEEAEK